MISNKEEKLKKGQKLTKMAALLVAFLAILKAVIGFFSGSIVLISDALHSGADLLPIFASWFGLKIAQRKPTGRFSYGFYKGENLATLAVSVFILYVAWEIFTEGYQRLFLISSIKIPILALIIALVDALVLYFFGNYEIKVGKAINAQSLRAIGEENRAHVFSSLAVFVGILSAQFKIPYLEGVITIGIAILILKIGLETTRESILALMDVSPSKEVEEKAAKAIQSVPGIEEFFDLRLRKAGPFIFGETKVGIRKFVDVKRAHEMADRVERTVKEKVPQIDSLSIHVEPFESDWQHLALPVRENHGLNSLISERFGRSPYFLFLNLKAGKIKGFYLLKNLYKEKSMRAGLSVVKLIAKQKSDVLITSEVGEISFYALRNYLIDLYQAKGKTAKEAIDYFIVGKLNQLERPTKEKA